MVNDDCIFCKLANGVFETNTLYEDDDFRVNFDASPATKGHVLILPKEHLNFQKKQLQKYLYSLKK